MIEAERNIRSGKAMGLSADAIVRAALLSELVHPAGQNRELWLVSAWVTDVPVIDNRHGAYDGLLGDDFPSVARLSHVLGAVHRRGTFVHVVTRPGPRHELFAGRLQAVAGGLPTPRIIYGDVAHEKTLCTQDWLIEGSMNFTYSGLGVNDESINYSKNPEKTAKAFIDFARRWGGK